MNRDLSTDVSSIEHLLPTKRKGKRGPDPGMSSQECLKSSLLRNASLRNASSENFSLPKSFTQE